MPAPVYPPPRRVERCLDLLFPPLCVGCRRVGRWICERCWAEVAWSDGERCGQCGVPSIENPCRRCRHRASPVRSVVAVAPFEGTAREAVHALKYEGRHAISSLMGRLMAQAAHEPAVDLVAPIPLHPARRRERGYDQAALLARAAGRELRLPVDERALQRTRRTRQQVSLGVKERRANVAGAFAATGALAGARILLIDDVFTTGATMEAAAEALLSAGAGEVTGAVFGFAHSGADAPEGRQTRRFLPLPRSAHRSR